MLPNPKKVTLPKRKVAAKKLPTREKTLKLRKIDDEELSQSAKSNKFKYLAIALILISVVSGGLFVFKEKLPFKPLLPNKVTNITNQGPSPSPQSTQEAKLTQIYEKEKNIPLKNFTPRYNVFEDAIIGFKIAYPVDFNAVSLDNGVKITPEKGGGEINVYVAKGSFDVKLSTAGASAKQVEILNDTVAFIKSTFTFTQPEVYNRQNLQQRFSQGNSNLGKY